MSNSGKTPVIEYIKLFQQATRIQFPTELSEAAISQEAAMAYIDSLFADFKTTSLEEQSARQKHQAEFIAYVQDPNNQQNIDKFGKAATEAFRAVYDALTSLAAETKKTLFESEDKYQQVLNQSAKFKQLTSELDNLGALRFVVPAILGAELIIGR